jgi:diaminopimelate decarboxylase
MDHFEYRNGRLHAEGVDLVDLAARAGTPTYVYSRSTLQVHHDRLVQAFAELHPLICYSVKSCSNIHVLRTLAERGCGMDVVSGGELYRTRLAGVPASRVLFAGVGKTEEEIHEALGASARGAAAFPDAEPIGVFNIESEPEFQAIAGIARQLNVTTRAALRVNPDVDAKTHAYTTTGKAENKFGVDFRRAREFFERFGRHPNLKLTGLHIHLGSPIYTTDPYVEGVKRTLALIDELEGAGFKIDTLDVGGGFAADYETGKVLPASEYARAIVPLLRERVAKGLRIIIEPGRTISANAGVLLTRVQYVKNSGKKKFIVCDAGMHTLLRPALYGAFHFIWPASVADQHVPTRREEKPDLPGLETADVVGPICESSDFLAKDRLLPPVARGDVLAVFAAGAYGFSMASRYNSHPFPSEVMVDGDRARVIRRRETYEDLVAHEAEATDV